jgi:ribonuclease-3
MTEKIDNLSSEKSILNDDDIIKSDEGFIFNPYNSENKEITKNEIETLLSSYGVPTKLFNYKLFRRAFIHKSYTKRPQLENAKENITIMPKPDNCLPLSTKSNERLEFLGDGVLECVTKYYLYRRFPKENEGFMTEKKIAIVKNESIGKIALEMGLHKWFIISRSSEEKKTRTNLKKLGCLFEAFIGALFLDFNKINVLDEDKWFETLFVTGPGFQMAQIFIESVFERHIDWINLIKNDDNYKKILQVKIQKEFKTTPEYVEINHDDENGYTMGVYLCLGQEIYEASHKNAIDYKEHLNSFAKIKEEYQSKGKILVHFAHASHKIKKKAEQLACDYALKLCM